MVSTLGESARDTARDTSVARDRGKYAPATPSELFDSQLMPDAPLTSRPASPGPLWRQSSSTWRHTSYRYSFSRDSRFKQDKASHLDIQKL